MNAVVLAVQDGKSCVLLKDGTIRNIPREYKVGETVRVASKQAGIVSMISAAAAALIIFAGSMFGYGYRSCTPCSYVTLDVNPSIEFELNMNDKVMKVSALNEDAEPVVASVNELLKKNIPLEEAINLTLEELTNRNYLSGDKENYLLFDVVSDSQKRSDKLVNTINRIADSNSTDDYHVIESSLEDHEEAVNNNMSTGRYSMMKEDVEANGGTVDETSVLTYKKKAVSEMVTGQSSQAEASTEEENDAVSADNAKGNVKPASTKPAVQTQTSAASTETSDNHTSNSGSSQPANVSAGNDQPADAPAQSSSASNNKKKIATQSGATEASTDQSQSGNNEGQPAVSEGGSNESEASTGGSSGGKKPKPSTPSEGEGETPSDAIPADNPDPSPSEDPAADQPGDTPGETPSDNPGETPSEPETPADPGTGTEGEPETPADSQDASQSQTDSMEQSNSCDMEDQVADPATSEYTETSSVITVSME